MGLVLLLHQKQPCFWSAVSLRGVELKILSELSIKHQLWYYFYNIRSFLPFLPGLSVDNLFYIFYVYSTRISNNIFLAVTKIFITVGNIFIFYFRSVYGRKPHFLRISIYFMFFNYFTTTPRNLQLIFESLLFYTILYVPFKMPNLKLSKYMYSNNL